MWFFKIESFTIFLDVPAAARSVRYDKSLGILCQKLVMLFLISAVSCTKTLCDFQYNSVIFDVTLYFFQCTEITLEDAGKILVPDYHDDTLYMALNPPVNPKSELQKI